MTPKKDYDKENDEIFKWVRWIISAMGLLLLLYNEPWRDRGCYLNENIIWGKSFEGKVARKFINHKNHNDETIVFDNGEETVLINGYYEISIGDSVVKPVNSFLLRIYKPSDTLELTYMLPCKEKGDFFYGGIQ